MEFNTSNRPKSRKLSIYEFFEILQIEWIVADLRLRLYQKMKDKEYWKKVRDGKKVTIEQIAEKNTLPTIFTDKDLKSALEHRIFPPQCFPNFHYKNDEFKATQEYYDLYYYYYKGSDVRCEIEGETKIGKIKMYQPFDQFITITFKEGDDKKITIKDVTRIL